MQSKSKQIILQKQNDPALTSEKTLQEYERNMNEYIKSQHDAHLQQESGLLHSQAAYGDDLGLTGPMKNPEIDMSRENYSSKPTRESLVMKHRESGKYDKEKFANKVSRNELLELQMQMKNLKEQDEKGQRSDLPFLGSKNMDKKQAEDMYSENPYDSKRGNKT